MIVLCVHYEQFVNKHTRYSEKSPRLKSQFATQIAMPTNITTREKRQKGIPGKVR